LGKPGKGKGEKGGWSVVGRNDLVLKKESVKVTRLSHSSSPFGIAAAAAAAAKNKS